MTMSSVNTTHCLLLRHVPWLMQCVLLFQGFRVSPSGCCQTVLCELILSLCFIFQYRIGQLYMISKHSHEQSDRGEGVEVVQNEPYEDPTHGQGQFTEKRVYLSRWVERVSDSFFSNTRLIYCVWGPLPIGNWFNIVLIQPVVFSRKFLYLMSSLGRILWPTGYVLCL